MQVEWGISLVLIILQEVYLHTGFVSSRIWRINYQSPEKSYRLAFNAFENIP